MDLKEASEIAKKTFNDFDKDNDGHLTKDELKPLLEKVATLLSLPKPNEKDIDDGLKKLDLNKNGLLEFNEFFRFFREVYQELKDGDEN